MDGSRTGRIGTAFARSVPVIDAPRLASGKAGEVTTIPCFAQEWQAGWHSSTRQGAESGMRTRKHSADHGRSTRSHRRNSDCQDEDGDQDEEKKIRGDMT